MLLKALANGLRVGADDAVTRTVELLCGFEKATARSCIVVFYAKLCPSMLW